MSPKSPARMLAEKWNRNDFEQAFYSTFKRGYSEDLGLIVRQLWLGLMTGKKSAAKGLVELFKSHGKDAGWHECKAFVDAIAPLGFWLLLELTRSAREERDNCEENRLLLEGLTLLFCVRPIEEILSEEILKNHRRLTGEEPNAESLLLLLHHHVFLTPPEYVEAHMEKTNYKSITRYTKALISHGASIMEQVDHFIKADSGQPSK